MPKSGERDEYGAVNLPHGSTIPVYNAGLRPLRARSPFFKRVVLWTASLVVIAFVLGCISVWTRSTALQKTGSQLKEEVSTHYNPSIAVRFPDIGKQVIAAWYSGCAAPISYSEAVTWPTDDPNADPEAQVGSGACSQPRTASPTSNPTPGTVYDQPSVVQNVAFLNGEQNKLPTSRASGVPELKDPYQEVLNYLAIYNNSQVMVTVTLGIHDLENKRQEPVLLSAPTISLPPVSSQTGFTDNPSRAGMRSVEESSALDGQLTDWASAWASNDASNLKQVTQDSSSRVYSGLGNGWRLVTSASQDDGDSSASPVSWKWGYSKTINGTEYAVAEVQFQVESLVNIPSNDPDKTGSRGQNRYTNYQTMDLLIGKYSTSLPSVVAWGQAGSWSKLTPYMNGSTPSKNADPTEPGTAPLPTPTPSR